MKKAAIFVLAAILVAVCVPVFAQQFPDVPQDHWAYAAVQDLASKGIIQGYPDGTFGGKRALTRYEFAQAIEKAIPAIAGMVKGGEGVVGAKGEKGEKGEPGAPGVSKEVVDNLQKLVGEFNDELSALNVDVQGLKRDLASLAQRVAAVEAEQARVKITGEGDIIARGLVNTASAASDKDSRLLGTQKNPLANSGVFQNYILDIKGKVSKDASVKAVITAGNYLNYALGFGGDTGNESTAGLNEFQLWNMYVDSAVKLPWVGNAQVVAGRFPFQLTPLTLKMVPADSYNYVSIIDNGDYVFDGGRLQFNVGKVSLTTFAAKSGVVGGELESLGLKAVALGNTSVLNQLAGARAVIGTPFNGNLGLTYYQAGATVGQLSVMGADFNGSIAKIALNAEYSNSKPNDSMSAGVGIPHSQNGAWNAKLGYQWGNLNVAGGYSQIQKSYVAPGYWSKIGRAVNLTNVEGPSVNLTYAITPRVSFSATGEELKPVESGAGVLGRTTVDGIGAIAMGAGSLDKVDSWSAGIKYALSSSNSVDLGYEESQWKPTASAAGTAKERYVTLGLGHSFSPNASLKAYYQLVEYTGGSFNPYANTDALDFLNTRGGVAGAQFQLKY